MIRTALTLVPGGTAALAIYDFATSRIGLVLISGALAYGSGWHMRAEKCDAASGRAELAAVRADLTAAQNAEVIARIQAAELENSDRSNRDKVDALASLLKTREGRNCGLSDGDARRLRDIR